jgi:hypothetical protein
MDWWIGGFLGGEAHRRRGEGNISTTDGHGWTRMDTDKKAEEVDADGANFPG